jgi:hypothetical protein
MTEFSRHARKRRNPPKKSLNFSVSANVYVSAHAEAASLPPLRTNGIAVAISSSEEDMARYRWYKMRQRLISIGD